MLRKQMLIGVAVGLLQAWCFADTHYVSPTGSKTSPYGSWTAAAHAIQPAIKVATAGDTVLVAAGTYLINTQINLTKGITLQSASGAESTIIDGNGSKIRCLYISHPQAVADGFTITRGDLYGNHGAGVKIENAGTLQNCVVKYNLSHLGGGGVACQEGGLVINCIVTGNECVDFGGGVSCYEGGMVIDSLVSSNNAGEGGHGGGLFLWGSAARARNCQVRDNMAGLGGGGVYIRDGATLEESRLEGNVAENGGGVYGYDLGTIRKCHLYANRANKNTTAGIGGGAWLRGQVLMKNCGIFMNGADERAGGVALAGSAILESSVVALNYAQKYAGGVMCTGTGQVSNCTIIQNQVVQFLGNGGGLYCDSLGTVQNTIIYSNKATFFANCYNVGNGGLYVNCCTKPLPTNGWGNIAQNPKFAQTDAGVSWALAANSPCIDAGWGLAIPSDAVDYMARPRVLNGAIDIGAVEFGRVVNDYNRSGSAAMTVYSQTPQEMAWFAAVCNKANTLWNVKWGFGGCVPVPGDYDGDGRADLAVFHAASGKWYIRSATGAALVFGKPWGFDGCIPVPGDYDNDGKDDLALYYPTDGSWYIVSRSDVILAWGVKWGFSGCAPVAGDYNGDGYADLAVFHAATGKWYIRTLSTGDVLAAGLIWGFSGCVPVPGDYDGDGRADLNVFHAAAGKWYVRNMTGYISLWGFNWGFDGCTPLMGDFNGGGKTELAAYHQAGGKWYIAQPYAGAALAWGKEWGGSAMPAVKP